MASRDGTRLPTQNWGRSATDFSTCRLLFLFIVIPHSRRQGSWATRSEGLAGLRKKNLALMGSGPQRVALAPRNCGIAVLVGILQYLYYRKVPGFAQCTGR
jgi:hypothetical protein